MRRSVTALRVLSPAQGPGTPVHELSKVLTECFAIVTGHPAIVTEGCDTVTGHFAGVDGWVHTVCAASLHKSTRGWALHLRKRTQTCLRPCPSREVPQDVGCVVASDARTPPPTNGRRTHFEPRHNSATQLWFTHRDAALDVTQRKTHPTRTNLDPSRLLFTVPQSARTSLFVR